MKLYLLPILTLTLCLSACGSKKTSCCPYQSQIESVDVFDKEIVAQSCFSPYLAPNHTLTDILLNPSDLDLEAFVPSSSLALSLEILNKAFEYEGVRYRTGGTSTNGMDCSGLVYTCYSAFGISLPRTSIDMSKTVAEVSRNEARPGDLVFFTTNKKHKRINHVGLVVETNGNEIKFIHASIKGGVKVSSTSKEFYDRNLAKIGRALEG